MKLTRDQIRVKLKAPELGASPALQFKLTGRISKPLTVPELELELELELAVPGRPDDELLEVIPDEVEPVEDELVEVEPDEEFPVEAPLELDEDDSGPPPEHAATHKSANIAAALIKNAKLRNVRGTIFDSTYSNCNIFA